MRTILGVVSGAMLAACGGSSHGGATAADVQAYQNLAQGVSTAAASYASTAQAAPDATACRAAQSSYDGKVRPMVDQMQHMSPAMDDSLSGMGGSHMGDADMGCGADAMKAELDHHASVACASADMTANHDEAAHHAQAMHDWSQHQVARCGEVEDHMGGGGGGTGSTGVCQHMFDGSYTLGGVHP